MDGVVQIAKKLDFTEMGVMKRQFYEDYWNAISHHLDGTIASLYHGGSKEWRALCLRSGRWNYHNRCGWHCTHLRYSNRHYFAELRKAVLTDERNN